ADRRHVRDHVRRPGRGPGGEPGGRAAASGGDGLLRRARPADRDDQPGNRRSQRPPGHGGRLPVGAGHPRQGAALQPAQAARPGPPRQALRAGGRGPDGAVRAARDRPSRRQAVHRLPVQPQARADQEEAAKSSRQWLGPVVGKNSPGPAAFTGHQPLTSDDQFMRLVFAGTPEFAVPALDALHAAGHHIAAAFTQPDRPAGRGRKLQASPVALRAEALGIAVHKPPKLHAEAQALLRGLAPEAMVVVAYGLLLPQAVLDIPPRGCLNIHASILPRWRGAAPIARAVEAGDAETGITIMRMDAGLDTGPMLLVERLPLPPTMTAAALHDALAPLGGRLIVEALARLQRGELPEQAQPAEGMTYARKLSKEEARLDWSRPAWSWRAGCGPSTPRRWPGASWTASASASGTPAPPASLPAPRRAACSAPRPGGCASPAATAACW